MIIHHPNFLVWNKDVKNKTVIDAIRTKDFNPLTAGAAYIQVFIFYQRIMYHLLNMLKIKSDINQQYLKTVDLHFVKSE